MQLSKVLSLGLSHFSIDVKQTETKVTVVFSPKTTVSDPAVKDLKPLIINFDSPQEMDEKFVEMITVPVEKTVQLFNGITDYEKQLAEAAKKTKQAAAEKQADAKKPKAAELKKQEEAKKKEDLAKATPGLEFGKEEKTEDVSVESPESPIVEEAKVVEETIAEKSEEPELVQTIEEEDEEDNEDGEDLFAGIPELFS